MFQVAQKEIKLFFGDKKAMMLAFLLPIALITLFTFMFGGATKNNDMSPFTILVCDEAKTKNSEQLIADIDSLPSLKVEIFEKEEAIGEVKKGDELAALIIYDNYETLIEENKNGFELYLDNTRPTECEILQGVLMSVLVRSGGKAMIKNKVIEKIAEDFSPEDSVNTEAIETFIDEMMSSSAETSQDKSEKTTMDSMMEDMVKITTVQTNEEVSPALVHSVSGTAVMMLLFSVAGMGASLLEEKEKGTLKRLLTSPLSPSHILFGKLAAAVFISLLQLIAMFVFAQVVFGLDLFFNLPALLITLTLTAFTCGSFGIFIASISTSRKHVEGLSTIVVLLMSAIGGSMVPSFVMPEFMQKLGVISVNYWSIQSVYDIYLREFSWGTFAIKSGVLFTFGSVLLMVSLPFYRKNILKIT